MKELLRQYAAYNFWANQRMLERISQLTDEEINNPIVNSFPGLYNTLLHMWSAESIWWQRLRLSEKVEAPAEFFKGSFGELSKHSLAQSKLWEDWVSNANETQLGHVFGYQNSKKELFKQPVFEMLMHLFNHGTYHRGQLVTMLRQLGADKIPQTDFILYARSNSKMMKVN